MFNFQVSLLMTEPHHGFVRGRIASFSPRPHIFHWSSWSVQQPQSSLTVNAMDDVFSACNDEDDDSLFSDDDGSISDQSKGSVEVAKEDIALM